MSVPVIKVNGKFVPAKKVDGKWVPDEGATLHYTGEALEVRHGAASEEPAPKPKKKAKGGDES